MKHLRCVAILIGLSTACVDVAQSTDSTFLQHRRASVQVEHDGTKGRSIGCGYILGRLGDSLLIVTAKHVVLDDGVDLTLGNSPQGVVRLFDYEVPLPYRIAALDVKDLTFLKVPEKKYHVKPVRVCTEVTPDDELWMVSSRNGWTRLPLNFPGRSWFWSRDRSELTVMLPGTDTGDSGSMIYSQCGLVGFVFYGQSPQVELVYMGYVTSLATSLFPQLDLKREGP